MINNNFLFIMLCISNLEVLADLKHLRAHGRDTSIDLHKKGHSTGACACRKPRGRRKVLEVVDNPLDVPGIQIIAKRHQPRQWTTASTPIPNVTESTRRRLKTNICKENHDEANWRRICQSGFLPATNKENTTIDHEWWTCEYTQFVASLRCGFLDSDYRGRTPAMIYDKSRTFPLHACKTPSQQPLRFPPRRINCFNRLATAIGVYPTSTAHIIVQLPRLVFLLQTLPKDVPILMASSGKMLRQIISFLSEKGILDPARIVEWDPDASYAAETLYFAGEVARGTATGGKWNSLGSSENCSGILGMPRQLLQKLIETTVSSEVGGISYGGQYSRRPIVVIVDRSDAQSRRVSNHGAMMESLRSEFGHICSLVEFIGEKNSISATISIFAKADIVIGPHGAALSFVSFMRSQGPRKALLEIGFTSRESMPFPPSYYMALALSSGASYYMSLASGAYNGNLEADIPDVKKLLHEALDDIRR